jgi:hypothetical protein
MRRMIIPALALALAAAPAMLEAQTPRPDRPGMQRGAMGMRGQVMADPAARVLAQREALGLTAAQVSQLEQIRAQTGARNQPLRQQLQSAMPAGNRQQARQRAADLTPEQRAQRRAEMEARRQQMQTASPEERQRMREQMRAERQARREEMRAQRQQQLTPEQRARQEERRAGLQQRMETLRPIMQQLQESNQQARREVEAVLTEEQKTRLRELQPQRGNRPERAQPGQRGQRRGGR